MERQTAEKVVDAIITDLGDRRGLRQGWEQVVPAFVSSLRLKWVDVVEAETPEIAIAQIVSDLGGSGGELVSPVPVGFMPGTIEYELERQRLQFIISQDSLYGVKQEWLKIEPDVLAELYKTWSAIFGGE